jgi:hypothetical protein
MSLPPFEYLEAVFSLARRFHVERLSLSGLECSFAKEPNPVILETEKRKVKIGDEEQAPTEDQMLFWSSPLGAPAHEAEPPA